MNENLLIDIPFTQRQISRTGFEIVGDQLSLNPALRIKLKEHNIVINARLEGALVASPLELKFGVTEAGSITEKEFEIFNRGNISLCVTQIEISNRNFSVHPDQLLPITIRPKQKGLIRLRFAPTTQERVEGNLFFFSHGLVHPGIKLIGNVDEDVVRISPPSVDFGRVKTGLTVSHQIRIWNHSSLPLKIIRRISTNGRFHLIGSIPQTIEPQQSVSICIGFTVKDESEQKGTLVLDVEGVFTSRLIVPLFGEGQAVSPFGVNNEIMQAGFVPVKEAVNRMIDHAILLRLPVISEILMQFFICISRHDPLSLIHLGGIRLYTFPREWLNALMRSFVLDQNSEMTLVSTTSSRLDISAYQGIYTWSSATAMFTHTAGDNGIRIIFPGPGSSVNDCEFQIIQCEEALFNEVQEPSNKIYKPQKVQVSLREKQNLIASLNLNIRYHINGLIQHLSGELSIPPFNLSVSLDSLRDNAILANAIMHKLSTPIAVANLRVAFQGSEKIGPAIQLIEGNLKVNDIEINGMFDITRQSSTATEINPTPKIILLGLYNKMKIAELISVREVNPEDLSERDVMYLNYGVGTTEKLDDILNPLKMALATGKRAGE
ncbi:MAG: choice-of-anchor D domain-containing protein [Phycisphaerae bacterium]|nr:choice-of-anchor D domain-containing protein [Phycisphaerae bacterium]